MSLFRVDPWRMAILLAAVLPAAAAAQETTFTPQHVAKLRAVSAAVISPDGTQVAYLLSVPRQLPREKDGTSWSELHVVDAQGSSTPYITGPVNIDALSWTPDSKSIYFLAKRDKDDFRSLYVIPTRGGEARRVLTHGSDIQSYSFSGDGKQVAFLATEPASKAKKVEQDQGFSQEIYEEDQPFVRVWIAKLNDNKPATMVKLEGSASELHWNPAEDKLAVALAPNPLIDEQIMFRKVHIVDLKTGKATNLENPGKMGQLAWSPDGKKLALISGADKHDPREGQLWVHDNGWKNVTGAAFKGHVESLAWPKGDRLAFQASTGVQTAVQSWPGAGGLETLIPGGEVVLSNISAARYGKAMAFIGQTAKHPPEVYFQGEGDKAPRRLTDNNPWLRMMRFAPQEVVRYKARDGLELEGVLIRPLNEVKGQRYPLVLTVHGGPEAHYANGWLTNYNALGQVAAAKGMAVFYPNYRGSTGYGVEFSMKGQKEASGKEFDDLVDGVDHLIKLGLVDTKKVGITGGSYGGYATAWGSTYYSDRFAAGVMFVGLSDLISCAGTTDIAQEMYLVHHRKWLWEDWDYFLKSSPIYHVEKSKTPLLILHGKADPRVHPSQSLELYRHLKVRGKAPVRLVLYPGEGHGNRRAASRLDYNLRLLQWMEHYLSGPGGAMPPYEIDYGFGQKSVNAGHGWNRPGLAMRSDSVAYEEMRPWLGGACPCCIGP